MTKVTGALPVPNRERIRAYAMASNDLNPLHLDPEAARRAGFDDVIAHGMLIYGLALSKLRRETGAETITTSRVRFAAPVPVGCALSLEYSLTGESAEFRVVDASGDVKIGGSATLSGETSA